MKKIFTLAVMIVIAISAQAQVCGWTGDAKTGLVYQNTNEGFVWRFPEKTTWREIPVAGGTTVFKAVMGKGQEQAAQTLVNILKDVDGVEGNDAWSFYNEISSYIGKDVKSLNIPGRVVAEVSNIEKTQLDGMNAIRYDYITHVLNKKGTKDILTTQSSAYMVLHNSDCIQVVTSANTKKAKQLFDQIQSGFSFTR